MAALSCARLLSLLCASLCTRCTHTHAWSGGVSAHKARRICLHQGMHVQCTTTRETSTMGLREVVMERLHHNRGLLTRLSRRNLLTVAGTTLFGLTAVHYVPRGIPTVCLGVTSAAACTYECGDGRIAPTHCALIAGRLGGRFSCPPEPTVALVS